MVTLLCKHMEAFGLIMNITFPFPVFSFKISSCSSVTLNYNPDCLLFHPISFLLFEGESTLTGRERQADEERQRREETEGKERDRDAP